MGESIVSVERTKVYTEEDWNENAVRLVKEIGKDASGMLKYNASKVLSEQGTSAAIRSTCLILTCAMTPLTLAAWRFYRENKHTLPYELSVIAPGWILGV